jgi:hypothetical protein
VTGDLFYLKHIVPCWQLKMQVPSVYEELEPKGKIDKDKLMQLTSGLF